MNNMKTNALVAPNPDAFGALDRDGTMVPPPAPRRAVRPVSRAPLVGAPMDAQMEGFARELDDITKAFFSEVAPFRPVRRNLMGEFDACAAADQVVPN